MIGQIQPFSLSSDALTLIGTIASVAAALAAIASLVLIIRQIGIMRMQTDLMLKTMQLTEETKVVAVRELAIVETQVKIQKDQDREFRKKPLLWAYSKDAVALSGKIGNASISLRVFNFGQSAASRFRIVIAVPPGYQHASTSYGVWTAIADFAPKSSALKGYGFFRHDSDLAAFPEDYVQFARLDVRLERDLGYENKPIFWRISTEAQQHPPARGEYYRLTSNAVYRNREAVRVHYERSGEWVGLG